MIENESYNPKDGNNEFEEDSQLLDELREIIAQVEQLEKPAEETPFTAETVISELEKDLESRLPDSVDKQLAVELRALQDTLWNKRESGLNTVGIKPKLRELISALNETTEAYASNESVPIDHLLHTRQLIAECASFLEDPANTPPYDEVIHPPLTANEQELVPCPHCGAEIAKHSSFCDQCGSTQEKASAE